MGICCWWWIVLKMLTDRHLLTDLSYSLSWWLLSHLTTQQLDQGRLILKAQISVAWGKWKVPYLGLLQLMFSVDHVQSEICATDLARGCIHISPSSLWLLEMPSFSHRPSVILSRGLSRNTITMPYPLRWVFLDILQIYSDPPTSCRSYPMPEHTDTGAHLDIW